jgi:pimeloyl-ACP methyl ester carboxylesterase
MARPATSHFHDLHGVRCHVRTWGDPYRPPLFLLHGWMDVSASWQFVADALADTRYLIAPDWRGFGQSGHAPGGYWFPDYLRDLEALLDRYQPDGGADLVGHSMGGNIACLYAGTRPARVAHLVTVEGFGMPREDATGAPERYARWLDQLRDPPPARPYPDFTALARRLRISNPRLAPERAEFLARHWGAQDDTGAVRLRADPSHRLVNPLLYRLDEAMACWRRIAAPVLWIQGSASDYLDALVRSDGEPELATRKACFRTLRCETLEGGHMLHHEQPERLASLIARFIAM